MERVNTAVIPEILARIVKELELINRWLDLRMGPENDEAIGKQEEWLNIYELCNMIPGRDVLRTMVTVPASDPAGSPRICPIWPPPWPP